MKFTLSTKIRKSLSIVIYLGFPCFIIFLMWITSAWAEPSACLNEITFDDFKSWKSSQPAIHQPKPIMRFELELNDHQLHTLKTLLKPLNINVTKSCVFTWSDEHSGCVKIRDEITLYACNSHAKQNLKSLFADMSDDGINELFELSDGTLRIFQNDDLFWESPDTLWVDDFQVIDSTHDGIVNLNMSIWRSGSFGSSKPFWIEKNDWSVKNHLFVMRLFMGRIKSEWCSSALPRPNLEFAFADLNNDGMKELIVIEGSYNDFPNLKGQHIAVWKWNIWGFYNEWRSAPGNYANLRIDETDNAVKIIVDCKVKSS